MYIKGSLRFSKIRTAARQQSLIQECRRKFLDEGFIDQWYYLKTLLFFKNDPGLR